MRSGAVPCLLLLLSCGSNTSRTHWSVLSDAGETAGCATGSERCRCYGNKTCDGQLTCASGVCVNLTPEAGVTAGDSGIPLEAASKDTSTSGSGGSSGTGDSGSGGTNGSGGTRGSGGTNSTGGSSGTGGSGGDSDAAGGPPSCVGLAATCGPNADEDCCASLHVSGGTYNRSNDPMYPATVSDFRLDRFEITVGRFRNFVQAYDAWRAAGNPMPGAGEHPLIYGSGWDPGWSAALPSNANTFVAGLNCDAAFHSWTDAPGANELKPINCIASLEAFAFCAWDGGRLSTEAEWNYAAAGGSEQRTYAWGSAAPTPEHASYSCLGDGVPGCTLNDLIAVGTKPRGNGKYGHADLAGNVFEWNLDFQNCCAPPWPGYVSTSCVDCAYLTSSGERELRGGSFPGDETWLPTSFRGWGGPRVYDIGARCARSP